MGKEIIIVDQKIVEFRGDPITAVMTAEGSIYVPIRPICDHLGVDWSAQRRRINRDLVLSEEMMSVAITATDIESGDRTPHTSEYLCLPLKFINGFLFGINASRVNEQIRDKLVQYQRECYDVLFKAFQQKTQVEMQHPLATVREIGLAIAQMAEEQMEHDRRIGTVEHRIDAAAVVVRDINKRLTGVEKRLTSGQPVSDEQASEIKEAVKALAMLPGEGNHFQAVFGELHRRFGAASYKNIQAKDYAEVMRFLNDWRAALTDT